MLTRPVRACACPQVASLQAQLSAAGGDTNSRVAALEAMLVQARAEAEAASAHNAELRRWVEENLLLLLKF